LNIAVIRVEPYISHESFLQLIEVRDSLNQFYIGWERSPSSYEEYMVFIKDLENWLSQVWWVKCILRYSLASEGMEGTTETERTQRLIATI
jgi:hypothetical protein